MYLPETEVQKLSELRHPDFLKIAKELNCTVQYVSAIARGRQPAKSKMALDIVAALNSAISTKTLARKSA